VASMQFGTTTDNSVTRRLRGDSEGRDLQEDDAVAAAEFELDFDVAQATAEGESSGAASYGAMASVVFGMAAAALM
jgi:hypothetical protein